MTTRMVRNQKPTRKPQRTGQRPSQRENPSFSGEPWGSANWPSNIADVTLNITELVFPGRRVAPFESLAALKASTTMGDGNGVFTYNAGASFSAGQYIILANNTQAHYIGSATFAWSVGARP